jgi:hypothetical protein
MSHRINIFEVYYKPPISFGQTLLATIYTLDRKPLARRDWLKSHPAYPSKTIHLKKV